MEAYSYLKDLYSGKNAIWTHITLFSILGIMVIFLNNLAASWGGTLYLDIFAIPPSSSFELWIAVLGGGVALIYLFGYGYQYIHSLFGKQGYSLPDFDLTPFKTFLRVFPMFFLWQNYLLLFATFGSLAILSYDNYILFGGFSLLVLAIMPFVQMILISFSSGFKYRVKFFYPWLIFRYIEKSFMDVLVLSIEVFVLAIIPSVIILLLVLATTKINNEILKYALELSSLCFGVYCSIILKYVYTAGLVKIVKNKIIP